MADAEENYTKLTVPQLKARCKELKIVGYSKLGKPALLEKLSHHVANKRCAPDVASQIPESTTASNDLAPTASRPATETLPTEILAQTTAVPPATSGSGSRAPNSENTASNSPGTLVDANLQIVGSHSNPAAISHPSKLTKNKTKNTAAPKRQPGEYDTIASATPQKKQMLAQKKLTTSNSENKMPGVPSRSSKATVKKSGFMPLAPKALSPSGNTLNEHSLSDQHLDASPARQYTLSSVAVSSTVNVSGRFRLLVPLQQTCTKVTECVSSSINEASLRQLFYLDFSSAPSLPPPSFFQPITIPPSLSQRKRINAWAVVLSGLSDAERRKCAFVSRAIRYAVYLSAIPIIERVFGARRLLQLPKQFNKSMSNLWPYLKQLQVVLTDARKTYANSFLARFFGSHVPIAEHLWGCPEHDKQLTIALRFLMTRVWFAISLNYRDIERLKNSVVVDACEIVKDEIWAITVVTHSTIRYKSVLETFYVLETTCEVIGIPPPPKDSTSVSQLSGASTSVSGRKLRLRVDWSGYVEHHIKISRADKRQSLLFTCLKTMNAEEYTKGISKLWLTRISKEGKLGGYKKRVAERYVLACVVGNSVSGQWMTSAHMAQVIAGTASESDFAPTSNLQIKENQKVNLFLPAHHLVESIHFTTSGSKAQNLHPALAIVQTPGREYFILRDNGMEVGCEEDGVWTVWMELLGCDARGLLCP